MKTLRERANLTQAQFASAVSTTEKAVRSWENEGAIPSFYRAVAIAKVLGVSLSALAREFGLDVEGIPDDDSPPVESLSTTKKL